MKFYSETLNRMFDSQEACAMAEDEHQKAIDAQKIKNQELANKRAERAKEVEELYKNAAEAQKEYASALRSFIKDYGSFHATFRTVDPFFSFFDF